MRFFWQMLILPLALAAVPAQAQDRITGPSPASSLTLDLYDAPDPTRVARQIPVGEAGLPLAVHAKEAGFYRVIIGGQAYWLRSAKVRVSRDVSARCGPLAMGATGPTASTPGAGDNACK